MGAHRQEVEREDPPRLSHALARHLRPRPRRRTQVEHALSAAQQPILVVDLE